MRLILLGPPGAGKGTQAEKMAAKWNVLSIATGDILREAVKNQSDLGLKAKNFMDKGELVPDEVIIGIIKDRLTRADTKDGFLLDGFPRTLKQARSLDATLEEVGLELDGVLLFNVEPEILVKRLTGRRVCSNCGLNFHIYFHPPAKEGICDKCSCVLFHRSDDQEEVVRKRLNVYLEQTTPLIDYYQKQNLLKTIQSDGDREDIFVKIVELLKPPQVQ